MRGKVLFVLVLVAVLSLALLVEAKSTKTKGGLKKKGNKHQKVNNAKRGRKPMDVLIKQAKEHSKNEKHTDEEDHINELDIKLTDAQWKELMDQRGGKTKRKALRNLIYRWTNNVVPYTILNDFSSTELGRIQDGIDDWETYTCLDFKTRTTEANYVQIGAQTGCWSYVGMITGRQNVSLGSGCVYKRIVIHELGHAIGLHHEQTRPDRESYVTIVYDNIQSGKEGNFAQYSVSYINDHGVPYDYTSIMHYSKTAFSKNGQNTINTDDPAYQDVIGTSNGLSFRDIKIVNLMYDCSSGCGEITCPGEGFVGKDCKCWCPGSPVVECSGCAGFECANGNCIDNGDVCNNADDCGDNSDEANCGGCAGFECTNGICIDNGDVCNGVDDCGDNSDEANCGGCSSSEFQCDNGICIPSYWECDEWDDCGDNSDEVDCACGGFTCANGDCIVSWWECDGWDDCGDNSDESGCGSACSDFQCDNGNCITNDWVCDVWNDCGDNSDESVAECGPGCHGFECNNGYCIPSEWKCDTDNDCGDSSDESGCSRK